MESQLYLINLKISSIIVGKNFFLVHSDTSTFFFLGSTFFEIKAKQDSGFIKIISLNNKLFIRNCIFVFMFEANNNSIISIFSSNFSEIYLYNNIFRIYDAPFQNLLFLKETTTSFLMLKNVFYGMIRKEMSYNIIQSKSIFFYLISSRLTFQLNQNTFLLKNSKILKLLPIFLDFYSESSQKRFHDPFLMLTSQYNVNFINQENNRVNECNFENIIPGFVYTECLCILEVFYNLTNLISFDKENFFDYFEIIQDPTIKNNRFSFNIKNVDNRLCFSGKLSIKTFSNDFNQISFKVVSKNNYAQSNLTIKIGLANGCRPYQYLDKNGICLFCDEKLYYKDMDPIFRLSSDIKTFFSTSCLFCSEAIGFFSFGNDLYLPKSNFWKIHHKSHLYFRCPFDDNCKGYDRNQLLFDEKLNKGFCFPNHKGYLCLECKKNYGRWSEDRCEACYSILNFSIAFLRIFTILTIATLMFWLNFEIKLGNLSVRNLRNKFNLYSTYKMNNLFIQILNSQALIEKNKFRYFNFVIKFLFFFSSNLEMPIPFECIFREELFYQIKILSKLIFLFMSFAIYIILCLDRKKIYVHLKNLEKNIFLKKIFFVFMQATYDLFFYSLIEFVTKIFFYNEVFNEETKEYVIISPFYGIHKSEYFKFNYILSIAILAILTLIIFCNERF